jgi:hypothetical protein
MNFIQYITNITHIYAWLERMCIMQVKKFEHGKEQRKAWGGGTNSIVSNTQNIKTIKNYER